MGYDNKLYALSSDTSAVKHRLHSPNVVLRTSSGNGQNHGTRRRAAVFKTEDNDDAWSVECRSGGSIHSHSAQAALKQQLKKRRRIERKAKEDEDDDDEDEETTKWQGLDMAELQSEKYLKYRERQRQRARDRPNETKVWPDDLENAFQLGTSKNRHIIPLTNEFASNTNRATSRAEEGTETWQAVWEK